MNKINPKVDDYLNESPNWREELEQLRMIVLDCGLTEALKWGVPCYTFEKKNVILLGRFKEYCVISFVKGALLEDKHGILLQQTENSQSVRIVKFDNFQTIIELEDVLKSYIYEAIEVEKAGLKVSYKAAQDFDMPTELQDKMNEMPEFKKAFYALTEGRQKGYLLHFAAAKQSKTRAARIEKYTKRILKGKGITDCVCGLSKKMPSCDGSHKFAPFGYED